MLKSVLRRSRRLEAEISQPCRLSERPIKLHRLGPGTSQPTRLTEFPESMKDHELAFLSYYHH